MKKIASSIVDLIGNTPLIEVKHYSEIQQLQGRLLLKLESFNPLSSVKDRIAYRMLEDAKEKKRINDQTVIIEPTSGNTGIGLAAIAAAKGYRLILTMPETMSEERKKLLKALGAELVLTEGKLGMKGAIARAEILHKQIANSFIPGQFTNDINPITHEQTTAQEIWESTNGVIDCFVAGIGTGGTITGIGRGLKQHNASIEIIGIEPKDSPVITQGIARAHKIQGIGAGFKPMLLDLEVVDEVVTIGHLEAYEAARRLAKTEGILAGISSGASLAVATLLAKQEKYKEKTIVVLLPDTGERYLSTELFE